GMVAIAEQRARHFAPGMPVEFLVAPVEQTGLPSESFDVVAGKWILHHADVKLAACEVRRVLKKGGKGVFAENSGLNPILGFARTHLAGRLGIPRYGTDDEHPLTSADFAFFADL